MLHRGRPPRLSLLAAILGGALLLAVPTAFADLLVSSGKTNSVLRYDQTTGAFIDAFVPTGSGGLANPFGLTIGPDGNLYVGSGRTVLRYDGSTGAFIDEFAPFPLSQVSHPVLGGILFGPDGNLYVTIESDQVLRFNGATGAFIDAFVPPGSGGLDRPVDMVFGPDGNLYVTSIFSDSVLRYDGTTGDFIDAFVPADPADSLFGPTGLTFGPDGNLYVMSANNGSTLRYDGTTGEFLGVFAVGGAGGIVFGPDGHFYTADTNNDRIRRFDGTTGLPIDEFVPAGLGGLDAPRFLVFTSCPTDTNPDQSDKDDDGIGDLCDPDDDNDGVLDVDDAFPNSDVSPTVVIDGIDTGVTNDVLPDGSTIADLIAEILATDPLMGDVVEVLVDLRAEGAVTGKELGTLLRTLNSP